MQLAQGLNLRVVAEGVERPEQLEFLQQINCAEVQGYYFGRPLSGMEFERVFQQDNALQLARGESR